MHARKLMSMLLAVVIVLGILFTAHYDVTGAEPSHEDYQVTFGSKSRSGFNIYGDTIVWQESDGLFGYKVNMYDTATKTESQVTSSTQAMIPDVYGDIIVWQDSRDGYSDIYMYDLDTKQETQVTDTPEIGEMSPVTDGNYIVYKPTYQSLAVYSISLGTTTEIVDGANYLSGAAIDHGKVVWVDDPSGSPKLQLYDISTKETTTLKTGTYSQFDGNPDISGNKVVWTDYTSSTGLKNVHVYDLITKTDVAVAPDPASQQTLPAIDGSKIVWLNYKSPEQVIYQYDLDAGGEPELISYTEGTAQTPKIDGDTAIWSVGLNVFSNRDIGPSLLDIVNDTAEAAKMQEVLEYAELGLELGDYKGWKKVDKLAVAQQFIDNRPGSGFSSLNDLQAVFDTAYADREAVAAVNFATDTAALRTALEGGEFQQIDLTGFQSLSAVDRDAAMFTMFVSLPADGFADETAIQTALDAAVERWTTAMWKYVGALDFADWIGDLELFQGTPYVASYNSFVGEGKVSRFDGTEWVEVGESMVGVSNLAMAIDGNGVPYVAYSNTGESGKLTVRKFDGTHWDIVGSSTAISEGSVLDIGIVIDDNNTPYVTYRDTGLNQKIAVKAFNGTDWELLGTDYVTNSSEYASGRFTAFAVDGSTLYIAYSDDYDNSKVIVKTWDGDKWTPVGPPASGGGTLSISLAVNGGTPYVALTDGADDGKLFVKAFDGSDWVPLGDSIGGNNAQNMSLAFDQGTPYLAFRDQTLGFKAFVKKFNGSDWLTVGEESVTDAEAEYTKLVIEDGVAYLGYLNRHSYVNKTNVVKALLNKGDVNGDGVVTPADALFVTKSVQGKITLTAREIYILDMNGDGKVTPEDAQLILQMYTGAK